MIVHIGVPVAAASPGGFLFMPLEERMPDGRLLLVATAPDMLVVLGGAPTGRVVELANDETGADIIVDVDDETGELLLNHAFLDRGFTIGQKEETPEA